MKKLTSTITVSIFLIGALASCKGQNKEESTVSQVPPAKSQELPVQMIKSPDGHLYFPDNYHRPRSDKDSLVMVYPSDIK